jgi:hypothetical protein
LVAGFVPDFDSGFGSVFYSGLIPDFDSGFIPVFYSGFVSGIWETRGLHLSPRWRGLESDWLAVSFGDPLCYNGEELGDLVLVGDFFSGGFFCFRTFEVWF